MEDLKDRAEAILTAGGCTGIRIAGEGENWQLAAFLASSDGVAHEAVAFSGRNPATPNDPVYLAGALLSTLQRNAAAHERGMGLIAPKPVAPEAEGGQGEGDELVRSEPTDEHANPEQLASDEHERTGLDGEVVSDAPSEPGNADASGGDSAADFVVGDSGPNVVDADFDLGVFSVEAPPTDGSFLLENRPDDIEVEEPQPTDPGGVAYFGDNIHTIKLAKMGRLSQIARAAKDALQEGWTLAEFASLQNLVVRIDRGEAPDDPEARARFVAISERSAAMARVDAYREQREGELEAAERPGIEAFDPEAGWP